MIRWDFSSILLCQALRRVGESYHPCSAQRRGRLREFIDIDKGDNVHAVGELVGKLQAHVGAVIAAVRLMAGREAAH